MHKTLTLLVAALMAVSASAQTSQRLSANKTNEYGLSYCLPVVALDVTLKAEQTVRTPGEFYQYAKKYLNLDPIITPSVSWRLVAAEITPVSRVDESERYLAQFKAGAGVTMTLTPEGFPIAVNDDEFQAAVAPAVTLKGEAAAPTILEMPVARQAVSEEMLRSPSSAKRAELAAAKIYELRRQRNDIIAGQAENMPSDGAAMKLALDQLADQEAALTAMFVGTVSTSTAVRTFAYTPTVEHENARVVIARLSVLDGIVDADDLSGDPVYLDLRVTRRPELPVNEKGVTKTFPKGGVAYRMPADAQASVVYEGATLATRDVAVPQFGVVFGIDPALFSNKKTPAYMRFDSLTGAIVEFGEN